MKKTCVLKIYRGTPGHQYWEEFEIELRPFLNITTAMMEIQKRPVNRQGQKVTPVAWEQGCLEEVCGSCSMLINGRPRQGCTALLHKIIESSGSNVITIAPMTKFPLVKDLVVDRTSMFDNLKKIHAWIDADDSFDRGFGPKISPEVQEAMYTLSTCMSCGCCTEACPQVNGNSKYVGPAIISQARLFNAHPIGKMSAHERLRPLMEEGGIADCGNSQNCVEVCPKEIPLTESIAVVGRQATRQAWKDLISLPDESQS
jgi:succinate dehydrogenase / fumarate reductase iron-sulfur subunit